MAVGEVVATCATHPCHAGGTIKTQAANIGLGVTLITT